MVKRFCNRRCEKPNRVDFGVVSSTVLIAPADQIAALKARADLDGAITFSDAEALRALDTITRQRPQVVVLDQLFASTSRGAALINRIKADPSLSSCEIRIVAGEEARGMPRARESSMAAGSSGSPALAVAEAPQVQAVPLDQRGTRRAPRFKMNDGLEMQLDGNPATLVDLSVVGAQVISPTILRPNQRVRAVLPDGPRMIRFVAAVAWASFEIPKGTVRYRAGVEFVEADAGALNRFIDANKK